MDNWFRVERFVEGGLEANCYTISFEDFSCVIDPCVSYKSIIRQSKHLKEIKAIFITHGHFDHFLELQSYIDNTDAIIYLHKKAVEKLNSPAKNCSKLLIASFFLLLLAISSNKLEYLSSKLVVYVIID